jgi:hypothetical protein
MEPQKILHAHAIILCVSFVTHQTCVMIFCVFFVTHGTRKQYLNTPPTCPNQDDNENQNKQKSCQEFTNFTLLTVLSRKLLFVWSRRFALFSRLFHGQLQAKSCTQMKKHSQRNCGRVVLFRVLGVFVLTDLLMVMIMHEPTRARYDKRTDDRASPTASYTMYATQPPTWSPYAAPQPSSIVFIYSF